MSYQSLCCTYGKYAIDRVVQHAASRDVTEWASGSVNYLLEMYIASEIADGLFHTRLVAHGSRLVNHTFSSYTYGGLTWKDVLDNAEMFVGDVDYAALKQVLAIHGYALKAPKHVRRDIHPSDIGGNTCLYLTQRGIRYYDQLRGLVDDYGTFSVPTTEIASSLYIQLKKRGLQVYVFEHDNQWCITVVDWRDSPYRVDRAPINYLISIGYISANIWTVLGNVKTFAEWLVRNTRIPPYATESQCIEINRIIRCRELRV